MAVIHKWKLLPTDHQMVNMPYGTKIIAAKEQYGNACIWGIVPTESAGLNIARQLASSEAFEQRHIAMLGTGQSFIEDDRATFIDTVILQDGALVVHVFEVKS